MRDLSIVSRPARRRAARIDLHAIAGEGVDLGVADRQVADGPGDDAVRIRAAVGGIQRVMNQALLDQDAVGARGDVDEVRTSSGELPRCVSWKASPPLATRIRSSRPYCPSSTSPSTVKYAWLTVSTRPAALTSTDPRPPDARSRMRALLVPLRTRREPLAVRSGMTVTMSPGCAALSPLESGRTATCSVPMPGAARRDEPLGRLGDRCARNETHRSDETDDHAREQFGILRRAMGRCRRAAAATCRASC